MHVALVGAELEENLAIRYLRAALEREGHRVTQIHFDRAEDLERAAREIVASGAGLAGLSMVFTRRADEFARLAARAKALGFGGKVVAGGHFAAFHADELLRDVPAIDVIVIGEGERVLCELARGAAFDDVPNLVWRGPLGPRRSPLVLPEQDIDTLAWPTRTPPFDAYLGLPIANLIGSRGCTHACAFCSIAAWHDLNGGARYRSRSADDVAAEMASLHAQGVRIFNFHDDNFLGRHRDKNLARVRALDDAWSRAGLGKIAFQIKARPDAVDEELFSELRAMGLFRVFLGIEAGTPLSLKQLGRGQKLEDNVRALEILNSLDVHTAFNLLLLNPDSTIDDVEQNVAFLSEHPDNPMNFCRTEIYEGTPLERKLRKQNRLIGDYWGLDYTIAEPESQRFFEIVRVAFWERNFGSDPVHYLTAKVDYEHQLRADFFGTTTKLRAQAKAFVRRVNENTVELLGEVIEQARADEDPMPFALDLRERIAALDVRFRAEGRAIVQQIRAIPERVRLVKSRAHSAFVVAAAIALVSCHRETQATEQAAPPTTEAGGPPTPDASSPTDASSAPDSSDAQSPIDAGRDAARSAIPAPTQHDTHMSEMAASPPGGWQAMEMAASPTSPPTALTGPRGEVSLGATSATVPVSDADRVVAGLRPGFRSCYNKGLASDPTMSGTLTISIRVSPNGDVESVAKIGGSGLSADVENCMINKAKHAAFSAPGGTGSTLQVPIKCSPQTP